MIWDIHLSGMQGRRALNELCPGGFKHNEQSVRVVESIEKEGRGLNLTWEVIDGIRNHKTSGRPSTLEGQIVRCQIRSPILIMILMMQSVAVFKRRRYSEEIYGCFGNFGEGRLNTLVHNVIIKRDDRPVIQMSEEVHEAMQGLRVFMFENVYRNPVAKKEEGKAIHMITNLYEFYIKNPEFLPEQSQNMLKKGEELSRVVCDYIAGMTDTYAVKKFTEFFIPESWKN